MAGLRVLDTNAVIAITGGTFDPIGKDWSIVISFMTRMELLAYPGLSEQDLLDLRRSLDEIETIGMNSEIEDATIQIRRSKALKLPDAIIAATAIVLGSPLVSNDRAFRNIAGLEVESF